MRIFCGNFDNMKKKLFISLFIVVSILSGAAARAQYLDPRFAIYLTSPFGILSKGGIKAEYRLNLQNALLLSYNQYWGFFPGYQGAFEYRKYSVKRQKESNTENFIYAKAGVGFADYISRADYKQISIFGDNRTDDAAPGTYLFGGGGVGRHYNFDWFFIDINLGLKFTEVTNPPSVYNEHLFYLTGPGSYLDVNLHFGVQF